MLQYGELDQSGYFVTIKDGSDSNKPKAENFHVENLENRINSEFKLWICDLLQIKKSEGSTNKYSFRGLSINIVDIYAVVTSVLENKFGISYTVDDGTGEICCWHSRHCREDLEGVKRDLSLAMENILGSNTTSVYNDSLTLVEDEESSPNSALVEAAQWMKTQILSHLKSCLLKLGDTVQLRGKLSDFRGERCINIYNIRIVNDMNEETDRRFELVYLYETLYSSKKN